MSGYWWGYRLQLKMAVRNDFLNGSNWGNETLEVDDINDTFDAATYRQIAINNTPITVDGSPASDTITVSVPAGSVNKYIDIKAYVRAETKTYLVGTGSRTSRINWRLYKTYSAVDTDLIATTELSEATIIGGGSNTIQRDSDTNQIFVDYPYEPTADERTNGFDVTIEISGGSGTGSNENSATCTFDFIRVTGA